MIAASHLLAAAAGSVMGDAGMTVLIGLVVVFATLVLLTLIFILFGKVMHRGEKPAPKAAVPSAPKAPAPVSAPPPPPAVQEGISEEVVAAIAAAVACMAPEGKRYAVRGVRRARDARPAWAAAGLAENTRPF